jgi:hypothetical protein
VSTKLKETKMTPQEEFQAYKADFDKKQLKRARIQAIVLASAAVITVLAMVYGTIQNIEANTQRDRAVANEQMAIEAKLEADKQRDVVASEIAALKTELASCKTTK